MTGLAVILLAVTGGVLSVLIWRGVLGRFAGGVTMLTVFGSAWWTRPATRDS